MQRGPEAGALVTVCRRARRASFLPYVHKT